VKYSLLAALMMLKVDCVAILLYDLITQVFARVRFSLASA
jgi:copper oxidase (laccase) domain-containing protein